MLAFTNTVHTKESAVASLVYHQKQDSRLRYTWGFSPPEGWKGCIIEYLTGSDNHSKFPELFGIDVRVAYLFEALFERLQYYKPWPVKLISSVKEGVDTTNAYYRFLYWLLMDNQYGVVRIKDTSELRAVGELLERVIAGDTPTAVQWKEAADAAYTRCPDNWLDNAVASIVNASANTAVDVGCVIILASSITNNDYVNNSKPTLNDLAITVFRNYETMADKLCYFLGGGV